MMMPTYAVSFIVFDFDFIENFGGPSLANRIKHRVYQPNDNEAKTSFIFALKTGELILDYIVNITGVSYELNKMDQIAIPNLGEPVESYGLVLFEYD